MKDLDNIEALARAATPGPWANEHNRVVTDEGLPFVEVLGPTHAQDTSDAAFIAAVSPDVVLALIARLRAAEAERDEALALANRAGECWSALVDAVQSGRPGVWCREDAQGEVAAWEARMVAAVPSSPRRSTGFCGRRRARQVPLVANGRKRAEGEEAMKDLDNIEALARAATPGPWANEHNRVVTIVRMLMDVGSEATSPGITEAISPTRFELAAQVCELMLQNATAAAWEKLLEWKKGAVDGR